jgi:hypothetical protein
MWHVRDLDGELVDRLWTNPDRVLASGHMLKDGDRCSVVRLDRAGDQSGHELPQRSMTLKRYNLKGTWHTSTHMLLRSRGKWSWNSGRTLFRAGVPTPMPLACIEERRQAVLRERSFLLTTFVPGRSLLDVIQSGPASDEQIVDLARQFARIWQSLGQLRVGHGDMKATNFIVDPHGQLWLIDLDGLRRYRWGPWLRRERRNDLERFMRNWRERPEVAAKFRARIGTG